MATVPNHMQELNLTKAQMVNTLLILTGLDDHLGKQFDKMSIEALNALYGSLSNMAMQCDKARKAERNQSELLKVEEARNRALSRDLRKAENKLKEKK